MENCHIDRQYIDLSVWNHLASKEPSSDHLAYKNIM